jgi:hypothetical protein
LLLVIFLAGCGIGGDPGGHVPARDALEAAIQQGELSHLMSCANAYDKLAAQLESGKVLDAKTALRGIESDEAAAHHRDIYELNKLLLLDSETEKFGMRQAKTIRAVADYYREAAK